MRGINKVTLIGNLGADPELRYLPSGAAVANFRLAVNEQWTDKQSGEKHESVEWVSCSAFSKTAEIINEHARKGAALYVEGKMKTRKWQAQDGSDRYTTSVLVSEFRFLGGKSADSEPHRQPQPPRPESSEDFDDDIPFN